MIPGGNYARRHSSAAHPCAFGRTHGHRKARLLYELAKVSTLIPSILTTINTIELIGSFVARHLESGTTVDLTNRRNRRTTKSAIPPLCRELIAQGHDPQERVRIVCKSKDRDSLIPVFDRDRRLEKWAAIDVVENEERGPHTVKYEPFPDALKRKDARDKTKTSYGTRNTKRLPTGNPESLMASA